MVNTHTLRNKTNSKDGPILEQQDLERQWLGAMEAGWNKLKLDAHEQT